MTTDELRRWVFARIGVPVEQDILTDESLIQCWEDAVRYWLRYMNPPVSEQTIGFTIPEGSNTHTFAGVVPQEIKGLYRMPKGVVVPCWGYSYVKPTLFLKDAVSPGSFAVFFAGSLNYTEMNKEDVPEYLYWLTCAYAKTRAGEFMSFASYQDDPFEGNGVQWVNAGKTEAKELEEYIRVNRDVRPSNLTQFRTSRSRVIGF